VTVTPAAPNLAGQTAQPFTAVVSNVPNASDRAVNWSITEANGGTLSALTAPTAAAPAGATYTSPVLSGTYHVVATSVADPTRSGSATITVTADIAVNPSQTSANLIPGQFVDISATVINTPNPAVTWSVPAGGGTLSTPNSPSTRYTAPAAPGTYVVTATSAADTTKKANITMTVVAVAISAAADATTIDAGSQTVVRATVTPAFVADKRATWALTSGAGSVAAGPSTTTTYSAPANSGTTATIVATSVADPSKTRTVTITVNAPPPPPPPPPPPGKLTAGVGARAVPIQENIAAERGAPIDSPPASTDEKTASTAEKPRPFVRPTKRVASDVPPEPQKKKK
jgi:hypothetical protein